MLKQILQGRFMKHPLHPILVHFPVGLWIASLVFDFLYFKSNNSDFARTSYYCIIGGLIGSLLAATTGLAEYQEIPVNTIPRRIATFHFVLNLIIILLYSINFIARATPVGSAVNTITIFQLVLSCISVVLLSISGYLGGRLAYSYGVGFRSPHEFKEDSETNQNRVA